MGNVPCFDGEVFTLESAQKTVDMLERERQENPQKEIDTPYGKCRPMRAHLQSGMIVWELAKIETQSW
jgi:hypothetical protein